MDKNLKEKTITALVWNSIDKFLSQILYAIFGIVLANILFPDEFGLIAIPMAISVFLTIFTDSGFTVALVQRKEVSDSDFNTVFTFNLLLSVSLCFALRSISRQNISRCPRSLTCRFHSCYSGF